MPSLVTNDDKINYPEKVVDVCSSFFVLVAENLNLHHVGKEDPFSFLKDAFPCKFHGFKVLLTSEAEIKV
jgi:hypothetical protein